MARRDIVELNAAMDRVVDAVEKGDEIADAIWSALMWAAGHSDHDPTENWVEEDQ